MRDNPFELMQAAVARAAIGTPLAHVDAVAGTTVTAALGRARVRVGDRARIETLQRPLSGEIVRLEQDKMHIMLDGSADGVTVGDRILLDPPPVFAPDHGWIGRVIDPDGKPLDGRPLLPGLTPIWRDTGPPPAHQRRALGKRLETGLAVFNTMLPIVQGQRIGLFAGSGVGKSSLIADLTRGISADVVVIALVGERGRELRHFVEDVLGPEGMAKAVVVAATSDRSAMVRRRCALSAMAVAEYFRDQGKQVCLFVDSVTRFCEAHREFALAQGEDAKLRGFPASTSAAVARLCERAGPGVAGTGDITAVFSVLVAGSDMDEPVADLLRGVLDGHVVLDREIAERGRFPAIDVVRSVSRALPAAASAKENEIIGKARHLLAVRDRAALMVQSGLYEAGSDPEVDQAISCFDALEAVIATKDSRSTIAHFAQLRQAMSSTAMKPDNLMARPG